MSIRCQSRGCRAIDGSDLPGSAYTESGISIVTWAYVGIKKSRTVHSCSMMPAISHAPTAPYGGKRAVPGLTSLPGEAVLRLGVQ